MEVIDKRKEKMPQFKYLDDGDVFIYGKEYYMKVRYCGYCNAVLLRTAATTFFENSVCVEKVKAKIVIEQLVINE